MGDKKIKKLKIIKQPLIKKPTKFEKEKFKLISFFQNNLSVNPENFNESTRKKTPIGR